ncbi:AMP-binding protein [Aquibaculum arenosum]|uniref:AMP-binding protein n=1 Tax=Aquibaculum arenosum TaxID=3032591 RepID=A0ABT5YMX7_9PROT|nr:AMP-binding protein [Fodinicurvata sp. CAU 1616]MDF2096328.1 AMP-binding protein [Fodinicurvata sp. CAU 1616]
MPTASAHVDSFARDNLPPRDTWPDLITSLPELSYPDRLNCGAELLDRMVQDGFSERPCLIGSADVWTYAETLEQVQRIARVLAEDFGLIPGNRVLLRAPNSPMLAACWLAVMRIGAIAVTTMPLLRAGELAKVIDKAQVSFALCDAALLEELERAQAMQPVLRHILAMNTDAQESLDSRMQQQPANFPAVETAAEEVALIAFTSGTTGQPKGTMHFHRDVLAICDTFSRHILQPQPDDIFCGSPPLAFTFGLGGLLTFPLRVGAATVLLEKPGAEALLAEAIAKRKASICFTAPTAWRAMVNAMEGYDVTSLRAGVSAGEPLPRPTWEAVRERMGVRLIDGIGATEMLHIFISASGDAIRPGATGRPVPGYEAKVIDDEGQEVPTGEVGRLAVRGPTGCRYLADHRQRDYVQRGWNITGDSYRADEDGYFWFQARNDDMIISSGYNIAGPEVEEALMAHPAVQECAVVGAPDEDRGAIVKAFIVLQDDVNAGSELVKQLQEFVKQRIAPYKYPRAIEFIDDLPRTETGKVQRFRLRQLEQERAQAMGVEQ